MVLVCALIKGIYIYFNFIFLYFLPAIFVVNPIFMYYIGA